MRPTTLLCSLLCGCATPFTVLALERPAPTAPSTTGWWRVETPHFQLTTDLSSADAEACAELIEAELLGLGAALGGAPPRHPIGLDVVVLKDRSGFERRLAGRAAGLSRATPERLTLFLAGPPAGWARPDPEPGGALRESTVRHELAHVALTRHLGPHPAWLAEGFAQYLATFRWALDRQSITLGAVNVPAHRQYLSEVGATFEDAVAAKTLHPGGPGGQATALYALAWALVFELINERPREFGAYLASLSNGESPDPRSLYDVPEERIDAKVRRFIEAGSFGQLEVPVKAPVVAARLRAASESEVATARLLIDGATVQR